MRITSVGFAITPLLLKHAACWTTLPIQQSATRNQLVGLRAASFDQQKESVTSAPNDFLSGYFNADISDDNLPPSLLAIQRSFNDLAQGSDIRGGFCEHKRLGSVATVARALRAYKNDPHNSAAPLTPMAAHCLGYAYATMLVREGSPDLPPESDEIIIGLGIDPRSHGTRLADAFSRGAQLANSKVRVMYTGVASTPAMYEFCRSSLCHGGVMVTASHLPLDRNGFKFFTRNKGGFTKNDISEMLTIAKTRSSFWYDMGTIPPSSGHDAVFCSQWVDWMPTYQQRLKDSICQQVGVQPDDMPLAGMNVVLNPGNGCGGFFHEVLQDLGANAESSINVHPDPTFPAGYVPNPESTIMIDDTIQACVAANADIGIMLDTDADRCGLVVPRQRDADGQWKDYEVLNRNRLIALLAVIFADQSPGCAFVTDSVTSLGLATFLANLGIDHVRYLKGYANVIGKAKELTDTGSCNAEVAIETSGHCAMQENDYQDDGTYTAVKVLSYLVQQTRRSRADSDGSGMDKMEKPATSPLLEAIAGLQEMPEVSELRMKAVDGSNESTSATFEVLEAAVVEACGDARVGWTLDDENLEGVRVNTSDEGSFFMLRQSLHDPILCLQIEATDKTAAREAVVGPLVAIMKKLGVEANLNTDSLAQY